MNQMTSKCGIASWNQPRDPRPSSSAMDRQAPKKVTTSAISVIQAESIRHGIQYQAGAAATPHPDFPASNHHIAESRAPCVRPGYHHDTSGMPSRHIDRQPRRLVLGGCSVQNHPSAARGHVVIGSLRPQVSLAGRLCCPADDTARGSKVPFRLGPRCFGASRHGLGNLSRVWVPEYGLERTQSGVSLSCFFCGDARHSRTN
jgi:hypothetical protein